MIRLLTFLLCLAGAVHGAVWQWSVPVRKSRADLWIPPGSGRVRGVLFAQHNMIERGIMEHPVMRRTLADCGLAAVFVFPSVDPVFDFHNGAGGWFDTMMRDLADVSGFEELAAAPVVPMGHSAHASFPWNFAAWKPERTLAVLSVKGDAPLTDLTGSGRPNPAWGNRSLDGVPGLMVMGEYEWWEKRLEPLVRFRRERPGVPVAMFADVGHGHFDATDGLVEFLAMFVRKAAGARLPAEDGGPLRAVEPSAGWLIDRWRNDDAPRASAAPWGRYEGPEDEAFWCFDGEMARWIEERQAAGRGKKEQHVGFYQDGVPLPVSNTHAGTELEFLPEEDGVHFRIRAGFIAPLPPDPPSATKDARPPVVRKQPVEAPEGTHAAGRVGVSAIVGPVKQVGPERFRISPDALFPIGGERPFEAWFLASHPGDDARGGAVRQGLLRIPTVTDGAAQEIRFPEIPAMRAGSEPVTLGATSDSGLPVGYYIERGPARMEGNVLHLTPLPARAKLPVTVRVVAWQIGRAAEPRVRTAEPVSRSFEITR